MGTYLLALQLKVSTPCCHPNRSELKNINVASTNKIKTKTIILKLKMRQYLIHDVSKVTR